MSAAPTFHRLRVAEVIPETPDACSLVLSVPAALTDAFVYRPGQYLTVRTPAGDGAVSRCYSLSSSPYTDENLKITVKRVPDGRASNWICDHVRPGSMLDLTPPAGSFTPASLDEDLLLLAAGSGITPIMGILKSVLSTGIGRVALVYANRSAESVIFGTELSGLQERYGDRLHTVHWLDATQGPPDAAALAPMLLPYREREAFVCGPEPFVVVAQGTLEGLGVPERRIHIERFESTVDVPTTGERAAVAEVTLDGQTHRLPWPLGKRLLDVLIDAGLNPPYSCRQGNCGACACRLLSGEVELAHNEVLAEEDFADGYILACQALPRSDQVTVTYY